MTDKDKEAIELFKALMQCLASDGVEDKDDHVLVPVPGYLVSRALMWAEKYEFSLFHGEFFAYKFVLEARDRIHEEYKKNPPKKLRGDKTLKERAIEAACIEYSQTSKSIAALLGLPRPSDAITPRRFTTLNTKFNKSKRHKSG